MENPNFIHLDGGGSGSGFTGIVYQAPSQTAGGVEINPGLGQSTAALTGQVLAYSFTTFGTSGKAIDFSKGFGASSPIIATGNAENQIIRQEASRFAPARRPAPNSLSSSTRTSGRSTATTPTCGSTTATRCSSRKACGRERRAR